MIAHVLTTTAELFIAAVWACGCAWIVIRGFCSTEIAYTRGGCLVAIGLLGVCLEAGMIAYLAGW